MIRFCFLDWDSCIIALAIFHHLFPSCAVSSRTGRLRPVHCLTLFVIVHPTTPWTKQRKICEQYFKKEAKTNLNTNIYHDHVEYYALSHFFCILSVFIFLLFLFAGGWSSTVMHVYRFVFPSLLGVEVGGSSHSITGHFKVIIRANMNWNMNFVLYWLVWPSFDTHAHWWFSQDPIWPWVRAVGAHVSGLAQGRGMQEPLDAGGGGPRLPHEPGTRSRTSTRPSPPCWQLSQHRLLPLTCCSFKPALGVALCMGSMF